MTLAPEAPPDAPVTAYAWQPDVPKPDAQPAGNSEADERDSWAPVDLAPYLNGEVQRPTPTVGLPRSDGLRLMYPGKEHAVVAEMESGKSWFAVASALHEMNAGQPVVYIHFEECDPSDTVDRLLNLGATADQILKLFRFVGPERQVDAAAIAQLVDPVPSLVVLDGVNEGMSLHRLAIREEDGAAAFRRCVVKPFIRVGAATLSLDHVVKDKESRGRYALGSIHKGNAVNGAQIMLETAEPFGRGRRGRSHVSITKDRPGHLRQHGRPDERTPGKTYMGELVVDDTRIFNPWLELRFFAPTDAPDEDQVGPDEPEVNHPEDEQVLAAVAAIRRDGLEANLRMVRGKAGLRRDKIDLTLARLVLAKRLSETRGPRGARIFDVLEPLE